MRRVAQLLRCRFAKAPALMVPRARIPALADAASNGMVRPRSFAGANRCFDSD